MHRKHLCIAMTLVTLAATSGCASTGGRQPSNQTPIPQALIEAARQASEARMVYADLQARLHGYSVESVRLDGADAGVPDFLKARVRLDYNGPMIQVLERVANDIGYRVNEYAKPAAGVGWSPWLRTNGDKPLIDHVREMNAQVPWHIVLDHRNQRLVVDYSAEGGMASQIREARDADQRRRESELDRSSSMPNTQPMEARATRSVQDSLTDQPVYAPRESAPEPQITSTQEWSVLIEGYGTRANAEAMVSWLAEDNLTAVVRPVEGEFEVRVLANDQSDAQAIETRLAQYDIPTRLDSVTVRGTPASSHPPRAAQTRPAKPREPVMWQTPGQAQPSASRTPASSVQSINTRQAPAAIARDAMIEGSEAKLLQGSWRIQAAYGRNLDSFGRHIRTLASEGIPVYLKPASSAGKYHLRVGPFDSRASMRRTLATVKRLGLSDAYALAPNQ